jgi:catechol 2,3-dioxygenase-like lactoylglutathione lyase family enzyme
MPPVIEALDHWTYVSRDIEKARRFYIDVLGAEPIDRPGSAPPAIRLAGNVVDFFPAVGGEYEPSPGSRGQHYALRIRLEDYDAWAEHLKAHSVPFFQATHGLQRLSIYLEDPDGYHLELTLGVDAETGRREIEKRGLKSYSIPGGFDGREALGARP